MALNPLEWIRSWSSPSFRVGMAMAALPLNESVAAISAIPDLSPEPLPEVVVNPAKTTAFRLEALPADTIPAVQQAVLQFGQAYRNAHNASCSHDDHAFPSLANYKMLDETMHGISREEGTNTVIIRYTFERTERIDALQTPEKRAEGYGEYRRFSPAGEHYMQDVFRNAEEACNVRFVEADNPQDAYFTIGVIDQTERKFLHNGAEVSTAGTADLPNAKGATLLVGGDSKSDMQTMGHEVGHILGLLHSHDGGLADQDRDTGHKEFTHAEDSHNAMTMSYQQSGNSKIGGYAEKPSTFQLLDVEALQRLYGPALAREAKTHIVMEQFSGTLIVNPGDALYLGFRNADNMLVDLRGGVENPSIIRKGYDQSNIWITASPAELTVENQRATIVTGTAATQIDASTSGGITALVNGDTRLSLSGGADRVAVNCAETVTHIDGFNTANDSLLFGTDIRRHTMEADGQDTRITLYNNAGMAGEVIMHGLSPQQLQHAHLRNMEPKEEEAIINGQRPFIYLKAGDNGMIPGYTDIHKLQYNTQEKYELVHSKVRYEGGNTHFSLFDHNGKQVSTFSLAGEHPPEWPISLTCNSARDINCVEGSFTYPDGVTKRWTNDGVITDARNTVKVVQSLTGGDVCVVNNGPCDIGLGNERNGTSYVHVQDSSALSLRIMEDRVVTLNTFRPERDKILTSADQVDAVDLGGKKLGLIFHSKGKEDSYCIINHFTGDVNDITVGGIFSKDAVPLTEKSFKELGSQERTNLSFMETDAAVITAKAEQNFPDLYQQTAPKKAPSRGRN